MSEHHNHPISWAMVLEKQKSGHSIFSPSGAEMWMTCSGSLIPNFFAEDKQTYEAAEGTVAHSVADIWLKAGERPDYLVGTIEECGGFEIEITEEMLAFVEDFVDDCMKDATEADFWAAEQRGDFSRLTPIEKQGGTADFVAMWWQVLKIKDLKYGMEPVDAFGNKQLRIYALCMFYEWDWLYNFQEIHISVGQPRLPQGGGGPWIITREELLEFAMEVKDRALAAWQPGAPRTPSIKGCRWCKIRSTCSALYFFLAEQTDAFQSWGEDEEEDISVEDSKLVTANEVILDDLAISPFPKTPDPRDLSTHAMAKLLRYRKLMENFFNAIERELLDRAISDEEDIPRWKLVEGRTLRKLVDDESFVKSEMRKKGIKPNDLYEEKMLSPAKMEKLLHTKLKMPLAQAKRFLEETGLTVKPAGKKTLAPADDKRFALPKDSEVFENWKE